MKERNKQILEILNNKIKNAECELNYSSNFELLVAVILSAQCTDKRVNEVTDKLFKIYNSPYDFANLNQEELEKLIYSCGFYKNKAKNLINMSKSLLANFNGVVPITREELMQLDGVGRKTANVVLSVGFNKNAIAVDTHVFRVSKRLGLSSGNTPLAVELDLQNNFDEKYWSKLHHLLILFGRYYCKSLNPKCENCELFNYCKNKDKYAIKNKKEKI